MNKEKQEVQSVIKTSVRNKLANYKRETKSMPFHEAIMTKEKMAIYSFIQSLNTTFGTSIYEPVGVYLAQNNFKKTVFQYKLGNQISQKAQGVIQEIMNNISQGSKSDKAKEIEQIRKVCQEGEMKKLKTVKADVFCESENGEVYLFDIKTVKPNSSDFVKYKRTLLEWIAIYLVQKPKAKIQSLIAFPYNPYAPEPYNRWTLKNSLDVDAETKIANEFWDFLAGKEVFEDLLTCFEVAGKEMRDEIDNFFKKFE